jgi:hypothetical protein
LKKKTIIGRKDKADLPDLALEDIDLKIDTGAYTSAIHCQKIATRKVNGKRVLTFTLLDPSHSQYEENEFSAEDFTEKQIKSSFGSSEKRFVIETTICLFGKTHPIKFSLSDRGEMRTPVLIGRKFLKGKFVIDPSKSNLSFKLKSSKK